MKLTIEQVEEILKESPLYKEADKAPLRDRIENVILQKSEEENKK